MGCPVLLAEMRPHYERCTTSADSCGELQRKVIEIKSKKNQAKFAISELDLIWFQIVPIGSYRFQLVPNGSKKKFIDSSS